MKNIRIWNGPFGTIFTRAHIPLICFDIFWFPNIFWSYYSVRLSTLFYKNNDDIFIVIGSMNWLSVINLVSTNFVRRSNWPLSVRRQTQMRNLLDLHNCAPLVLDFLPFFWYKLNILTLTLKKKYINTLISIIVYTTHACEKSVYSFILIGQRTLLVFGSHPHWLSIIRSSGVERLPP